jgi:hypothetical protein
VTWSVNGVDGGGAGAGTITPGGFYTAPPSPPPKPVKIRARSASGAHDQRTVRITVPREPSPSPWVDDPRPARGALLSRIATTRQGHILVAGLTPGRAGTVSMHARAGSDRRFGSCRTRTPAGRQFTCRFNVPPGVSLSKLRLVARLTRHGRVVATAYRDGAPGGAR